MEEQQSPFKVELESLISHIKTGFKNPVVIGLVVLFVISFISTFYILFLWKSASPSTQIKSANFALPPVKKASATPTPNLAPTPTASATPTPTLGLTSSWSTFTNAEYRYAIKYPPGWMVSYVNSTDPLIPNFVTINQSTASAKLNSITISYTTRTNGQLTAIYGSTNSATLMVASQSATEYDQQDSDGNKSISIVLEEPSYAYIFYAMAQYKSLLLQMLSTFVLNP